LGRQQAKNDISRPDPVPSGTTREFLEAFSLKDLASLPTLKDIQELAGSFGDAEQAELPLGEPVEAAAEP